MTVCIAASYMIKPGWDGVATAVDWKLTDTQTGITSETGSKAVSIARNIVALGADDMDLFHDVIDRVDVKIGALSSYPPTVSQVADLYLEAEADWRQEYLQRHVLSKQGITWESLFDKMAKDELSQSYVENIQHHLGQCEVPYATEAIIAGTDDVAGLRVARMFKITPHTKDNCSQKGFAIIGEGSLIADAEFQAALYDKFWPRAASLFLCFVAKRQSEVISSVGRETSLQVMNDNGDGFEHVSHKVYTAFEKAYNKLRNRKLKSERIIYEEAKKAFDQFQVERW